MKKRLIIIENNHARYFVSKQLIEFHLRIKTKSLILESSTPLESQLKSLNPSEVIFPKPAGALELVESLRERQLNTRNAEVIFLMVDENDARNDLIFSHAA